MEFQSPQSRKAEQFLGHSGPLTIYVLPGPPAAAALNVQLRNDVTDVLELRGGCDGEEGEEAQSVRKGEDVIVTV